MRSTHGEAGGHRGKLHRTGILTMVDPQIQYVEEKDHDGIRLCSINYSTSEKNLVEGAKTTETVQFHQF